MRKSIKTLLLTLTSRAFILIFSISTFAASVICSANAAPEPTRPYRHAILEKGQNSTKGNLGEDCANALQIFFRHGGKLKSPQILAHARPVSKTPFNSKVIDHVFYHYTNNVGLTSAALSLFPQIFRTAVDLVIEKNDTLAFYIAEDPSSSQGYGNVLIRIEVRPDALVYDGPLDSETGSQLTHSVYSSYGLDACANSNDVYRSARLYILLEENDIPLVNYFEDYRWFELLSSDVIVNASVVSGNLQRRWFKEDVQKARRKQ